MTVGILTEKKKAAEKFAAALGGMSGTFNGEDFVIAHASGHLYKLTDPQLQIEGATAEEQARLKIWGLENLPWPLERFSWKYVPDDNSSQYLNEIKRQLSGCDEIVCATDIDPTGEGGLIFGNIVLGLGLSSKPLSRMYFTDEAAPSLQKAFRERKKLAGLENFDEYRKASYRSAWDFASMQFTRVATALARASNSNAIIRQGRLKSCMVKLTGDQLEAYNNYVRKPFFQNRFRDDHGVMYTNPDEQRYDQKSQVPAQYKGSSVVVDEKSNKTTAPPRLLDLAGLSTLMSKKGVKPAQTLKTYQAMYEADIVSYPRTEDRTITPEQFAELDPLVDKIAAVVGVDPALLTHRTPRSSHVKAQGAHGANRPGLSVPISLSSLTVYGPGAVDIYEALAKNYLAMLADDYRYEQQKGHVKDYPDFRGIANVPQSQGWKAVFDAEAGDPGNADENESATGLGTQADPFVFEGENKRPEHPSMGWLMKQLEKRDVGTGSTRASTYADVTNERTDHPLMRDTRGKLTLAPAGEISWRLLPGTNIGDLTLTERVLSEMKEVAAGTARAEDLLAKISGIVVDDIATMTQNAVSMRSALGLTERQLARGVWQTSPDGPREVAFKDTWGSHKFSQAEIDQLLAGETISFETKNAQGKPYTARGALAVNVHEGRRYVGFAREIAQAPTTWLTHTFTPAEIADLLAGKKIPLSGVISPKTKKPFACDVTWDASKGQIVPEFSAAEPPKSWAGRPFSDEERKKLAAGEKLELTGFISTKTKKPFPAIVQWVAPAGAKGKGGNKSIVMTFPDRGKK